MFFTPTPYIDFVPCKCTEGKDWYIHFQVKSPLTGKLTRVRNKINHVRGTAAQRRRIAKQMMAAIDRKLSLGWNPLLESGGIREGLSIGDAIQRFIAAKERELEPTSMKCYRSFSGVFTRWLGGHVETGASTPVASFTTEMAVAYMDDIETRVSPRTYNGYVRFFRILWGWFIRKGFARLNPFSAVKSKRKGLTAKERRVMTDQEVARVFDYAAAQSPSHVILLALTYCCLIRPKESALLRCCDIDLKRQTIHVGADIAKNDKSSDRTIPSALLPAFRAIDLSNRSYYLFGDHLGYDDFAPGPKPISPRKITEWWIRRVRPECHFGADVQFYGLKDTGITNLIGKGVALNFVRQQADHSSLAMTSIYVGKKDAPEELKEADILPDTKV